MGAGHGCGYLEEKVVVVVVVVVVVACFVPSALSEGFSNLRSALAMSCHELYFCREPSNRRTFSPTFPTDTMSIFE